MFTTAFAVAIDPVRATASRARTAPSRLRPAARITQLLAGLAAVAFGCALVIRAELGLASWDLLNVAVATRTGIPIALTAALAGLVAAGVAATLGARPRLTTLVPLVVVTPLFDLGLRVTATPSTFTAKVAMLLAGMVLLATGVGAYVGAEYGAGPADLVFLGLIGKGLPVWAARFTVDGVTGLGGLLLGGRVGLGTVLVTVGMGPLVASAIRAFDLRPSHDALHRSADAATPVPVG